MAPSNGWAASDRTFNEAPLRSLLAGADATQVEPFLRVVRAAATIYRAGTPARPPLPPGEIAKEIGRIRERLDELRRRMEKTWSESATELIEDAFEAHFPDFDAAPLRRLRNSLDDAIAGCDFSRDLFPQPLGQALTDRLFVAWRTHFGVEPSATKPKARMHSRAVKGPGSFANVLAAVLHELGAQPAPSTIESWIRKSRVRYPKSRQK